MRVLAERLACAFIVRIKQATLVLMALISLFPNQSLCHLATRLAAVARQVFCKPSVVQLVRCPVLFVRLHLFVPRAHKLPCYRVASTERRKTGGAPAWESRSRCVSALPGPFLAKQLTRVSYCAPHLLHDGYMLFGSKPACHCEQLAPVAAHR